MRRSAATPQARIIMKVGTRLYDKVREDAVQDSALVDSKGAEGAEVLRRHGRHVSTQLEHDAAERHAARADAQVHARVAGRARRKRRRVVAHWLYLQRQRVCDLLLPPVAVHSALSQAAARRQRKRRGHGAAQSGNGTPHRSDRQLGRPGVVRKQVARGQRPLAEQQAVGQPGLRRVLRAALLRVWREASAGGNARMSVR